VSTRYVGFFAEHTGYGRAAVSHACALASTGHPLQVDSVLLSPSGPIATRPRGAALAPIRKLMRRQVTPRTLIVHTPVQHYPLFRDGRSRQVGFSAWETLEPPASWSPALDSMDELWVPSSFCRQALEPITRRPIHVIAHPIRPALDGPRELAGIDSGSFLFLSILEWSDRKNPIGLLRAFRRAFAGRSDVELLLKVGLGFRASRREVLGELQDVYGTARYPSVSICFDQLSDAMLARLYRRADAYLSLHRAEGFGLCIAEAMAAGKPAVATGYSGNLDFTNETNAFLVDYRLTPARERLTRAHIFTKHMRWAEPNEESAIEALRQCAFSPALREKRAFAGRDTVLRMCSPGAIGEQMRARLQA